MNFSTAVRTCFRKYATFTGAAPRSEYWWFVLFIGLVNFLLLFTGLTVLRLLWSLVVVLPQLAVTVRRHHDAGRSGWWIFAWIFFPWEIILLCYPSKLTNNKYVADRQTSDDVHWSTDVAGPSSVHCAVCGKLRLPGQVYCVGCGTKFPD